ncbi:MAG: phosphatidylglycerophosphatase A [Agarilytica sp.]
MAISILTSKKSSPPVDAKLVFRSPQMFLAFGLGSGLSPVIPGTMGTLAAVPFYIVMAQLPIYAYAVILLLAYFLGNYLCDFASKKLGVHDHGGIVWDEFVGFWLTMFLVPFQWQYLVVGFVLFRFFDMLKPWPISWVDKHAQGGFGIMIDDVLAGVAAWLCLQLWIALV